MKAWLINIFSQIKISKFPKSDQSLNVVSFLFGSPSDFSFEAKSVFILGTFSESRKSAATSKGTPRDEICFRDCTLAPDYYGVWRRGWAKSFGVQILPTRCYKSHLKELLVSSRGCFSGISRFLCVDSKKNLPKRSGITFPRKQYFWSDKIRGVCDFWK